MRDRLNTTIDKDLLEQAKIKAIKEGKRLNDIIEEALREYMKGERKMMHQIDYTYEELLKTENEKIPEEMAIKTHPDGGKLALYAGKTIIDWADYEDTDRVEGWKREYNI